METISIIIIVLFIVGMLFLIAYNYRRYEKNKKKDKIQYAYYPSRMLSKEIQQLINLINQIRLDDGLPLVYEDAKLTNLAQLRAKATTEDFSHAGFPNASLELSEAGMDHSGEILAKGYNSPIGAVQGWLNSPSHKDIMLKAKYQYIGAGIDYDSDGRAFYCVLFGFDKEH